MASALKRNDNPVFVLLYSLFVTCILAAVIMWDRRYRRKWHEFLAKDWPPVEGIFVAGEGEIITMQRGSSKAIAGYECRLYYEYQSHGEEYGIYKRFFSTKREAEAFLKLLDGKKVPVKVKPGKPSTSNISDRDVEALVQSLAGRSPLDKHNLRACDDEKGNCKVCGHPFDPHLVIAYDGNDLTKGGEMRCQVPDCNCFQTLSFDLSDKEWVKKLHSLLKPPS